ncbi:diguanylate cyclase domain-containing protein [Novosphingobium sp. KCTC 2891]|uniref:sensor domain-containing diguanylate cyclase n=1 Tax=Novosphingobium sp. KCTC 2891 TaxID=2989730 RepID=UPI0022222BD3|nr:diguanylate cyclase [Novosphingobium sp. KCTC 2891]
MTDAALFSVFLGLALAVQATRFDGGVAFVWVATPAAIAVLLHGVQRRWPEVLALAASATVLAFVLAGQGLVAGVGIALANAVEAIVAAALLRRGREGGDFAPGDDEVVGDFLVYCFAIALVGPALGAFCASLWVHLALGWSWSAILTDYFVAHALGNIIFIPLFSLVASGDLARWAREQTGLGLFEQLGLASIVALCGFAAFGQDRLPLLVLPVLATMMATYRFDRVGATLSVVVLAAIGSVLTIRGVGPMALGPGKAGPTVQLLQAYLAVIVLCAQPLARNIAQRGRLELALRESRALYRLLAENTTEVVLKTDADGFVTYVSPAAERCGHWSERDLLGHHVLERVHASHKGQVSALFDAAIDGGDAAAWTEYVALTGDGSECWFEVQAHGLIDEHGHVYGAVAILRDIAERKAFEEQLFEAGLTDPLTGLSNRRAFIAMLQHHLDDQAGGCVAMFDLDHFRAINDRHGHQVGDKVLILFGSLARSLVRAEDTVARMGGEKFGILLPRASPDQAEMVCQRILSSFSGTTRAIGDSIIRTTASAGVARLSGTADDAMRSADLALYTAKAKGRDRLEMAPRLRPSQQPRW